MSKPFKILRDKMKNPKDYTDLQELRGMIYFWQHKYCSLEELTEVYVSILLENNLVPSLEEVQDRINKKHLHITVK